MFDFVTNNDYINQQVVPVELKPSQMHYCCNSLGDVQYYLMALI